MIGIWFVLVPLCIISIRFFKPKPTFQGITEKIGPTNIKWWWFHVHKYGLYLAVGLSLGGMIFAIIVSKGFSGSLHSIFGAITILLGCLQVASSWFRGTHGGKYYNLAVPDDPSTWHGDHFDMTPRRRRFEAYHKTAGYLTGFLRGRCGRIRPHAVSPADHGRRRAGLGGSNLRVMDGVGIPRSAERLLPGRLWI